MIILQTSKWGHNCNDKIKYNQIYQHILHNEFPPKLPNLMLVFGKSGTMSKLKAILPYLGFIYQIILNCLLPTMKRR